MIAHFLCLAFIDTMTLFSTLFSATITNCIIAQHVDTTTELEIVTFLGFSRYCNSTADW